MTTMATSVAATPVSAPRRDSVKRPAIRPPKFADKFALLDFEADPFPVISMFAPPAPLSLDDVAIAVRGQDLLTRQIRWRDIDGLHVYEQVAPLVCQIFNWYEIARWRGVLLCDFIERAGLDVPPDGFLSFHSGDGEYFETLALHEALDRRTMLAFGLDGEALPHEYGGPLRLVVPFLQGYKSVKWLTRIEAFQHDPAGIKRLLGQSKTGALGRAWLDRLGIVPPEAPAATRAQAAG